METGKIPVEYRDQFPAQEAGLTLSVIEKLNVEKLLKGKAR